MMKTSGVNLTKGRLAAGILLVLIFGGSTSWGAYQLSMSTGKGGDLYLVRLNTVTGQVAPWRMAPNRFPPATEPPSASSAGPYQISIAGGLKGNVYFARLDTKKGRIQTWRISGRQLKQVSQAPAAAANGR